MQALLVVLALAVIFLSIYLVRYSRTRALKTSANKQDYKSKYQAEQQLIHDAIIFDTTATNEEIVSTLTQYVAPQPKLPITGGVLYELSRDCDFIEYAFGNKIKPKLFIGIVRLNHNGNMTRTVFKFTKWTITNRTVIKSHEMALFSQQVYDAFSAVNVRVKSSVFGSPESSDNIPAPGADSFDSNDG
ncbi:MAG: hypothetical protein ABF497_04385 [Sporolactobacillus sp.]